MHDPVLLHCQGAKNIWAQQGNAGGVRHNGRWCQFGVRIVVKLATLLVCGIQVKTRDCPMTLLCTKQDVSWLLVNGQE